MAKTPEELNANIPTVRKRAADELEERIDRAMEVGDEGDVFCFPMDGTAPIWLVNEISRRYSSWKIVEFAVGDFRRKTYELRFIPA